MDNEEILVTLRVSGQKDVDLFISKGRKLPSTTDFFLHSRNWKNDEILIPALRKSERGEPTTYTIGVYGYSKLSEYSLMAVSSKLKLIKMELGTIYSTEIQSDAPLLLRDTWLFDSSTKLCYYSFDSIISLFIGVEGKNGIVASVPNDSNKIYAEASETVGQPKMLQISRKDLSKHATNEDAILLSLYPSYLSGSVNFFIFNQDFMMEMKQSSPALRVSLAKQESVRIKVVADNGELSNTTVVILGDRKTYTMEFDER
jgi:hypothetical protein